MAQRTKADLTGLLQTFLSRPQALAFLPAVSLAAFWLGGEGWLLLAAIGLPALYALGDALARNQGDNSATNPDQALAEESLSSLDHAVQSVLTRAARRGQSTACLILAIDDFDDLLARFGVAAADRICRQIQQRIASGLRDDDHVLRLPAGRFGIALAPMQQLDLESAIQIAARMQTTVEATLSLDSASVYLSCSLGFCLSARNPGPGSAALINAAQIALQDAQINGPSAIRAHTDRKAASTMHGDPAQDDVIHALENGQILPWFQPQISTHTGQITGFEALARWDHPDRGLIPPSDFLPRLAASGQMERLSEVILFHALTAMRAWDAAGHRIPRIGVNFATEELHNPKLVDKIHWELDRFDLSPDRLSIEVLETVVAADPDDIVSRNIAGLARLGCGIDLDDFGTGHASIAAIRRFAVSRIKIDRSFVMKIDRDPAQQRMVNAILTMADTLEVDTLAEGVETAGEHAMLAQLGCSHVQGFGIARPMPFGQTVDWIIQSKARIGDTPVIKGAQS